MVVLETMRPSIPRRSATAAMSDLSASVMSGATCTKGFTRGQVHSCVLNRKLPNYFPSKAVLIFKWWLKQALRSVSDKAHPKADDLERRHLLQCFPGTYTLYSLLAPGTHLDQQGRGARSAPGHAVPRGLDSLHQLLQLFAPLQCPQTCSQASLLERQRIYQNDISVHAPSSCSKADAVQHCRAPNHACIGTRQCLKTWSRGSLGVQQECSQAERPALLRMKPEK